MPTIKESTRLHTNTNSSTYTYYEGAAGWEDKTQVMQAQVAVL